MTCLFCEIASKKKPAALIAENEEAIAILDINPASDGHTLLITKKHFVNLSKVDEESWKYLLPLMKEVIRKLENTFQPAGFNIISNLNEIAAQSIFHLHIHIIPKYEKNQGFIWTARPVLKYSLEKVVEKLKKI
ncbi:MAG: HIT family protein [Candidatus Moeniiplasma glomeromycotorum]|nr:HIT family protein [Candidatus Moeniiplasma glomeromycotorum]MCE8167032.1 HIT family protein [Candidatus Moeniiplasma glomeromycotorum]MCE8168956.1 HIT family protein [Candidatus Moeniiplasma glomeromycotorum]